MAIPSLQDINVHDSLDEQAAAAHFLGRDQRQAEALFRQNFLCYQEDLMWMGPRAFCFYVPAALAYLLSAESEGDSDAANCFCSVVEFRWEYHAVAIAPARGILLQGIERLIKNFERFGCDPQIYGDLRARYEALRMRLAGE